MTRFYRTLIVVLILSGCAAERVQGVEIINRPHYVVASNAVVIKESVVFSDNISVHGTAADDLFLIVDALGWSENKSGNVTLTGIFSNDVWALGRIITFSGQSLDHVRLIGATSASIKGTIARSLFALSGMVYLGQDAHIHGSAYLIANTLAVNGSVSGELTARAREINLSGSFGDNVYLVASEKINVMPGTVIKGNLHYTSPSELILDSHVKLSGKLIRDTAIAPTGGFSFIGVMIEIGFFCMAVITGLLWATYFSGFALATIQNLEQARGKSFLVGVVSAILFPLAGIAVAATSIGLPLGLLILGLYVALIYLGKFAMAMALGRLVFANRTAPKTLISTLAAGLVIVYIAVNLPYPIGIIAWVCIAVMGLGAMVLAILDRRIPVFIAQGQERNNQRNDHQQQQKE